MLSGVRNAVAGCEFLAWVGDITGPLQALHREIVGLRDRVDHLGVLALANSELDAMLERPAAGASTVRGLHAAATGLTRSQLARAPVDDLTEHAASGASAADRDRARRGLGVAHRVPLGCGI